jgi:putative endonuclease
MLLKNYIKHNIDALKYYCWFPSNKAFRGIGIMFSVRTKGKTPTRYPNAAKKPYIPKPSKAWAKRDEGAKKFYVYILKLNDGDYYIGQTREIRERMMEHRDGRTPSVSQREPKLQYFEILGSRESAMLREKELKNIAKKNRREIVRIIREFQDVIKELDYN